MTERPFPATYQEFRQQLADRFTSPEPDFPIYTLAPQEAARSGYLVSSTGAKVTDVVPVIMGRVITPEERKAQQAEHQARADQRRHATLERLTKAHPALQPIIALHSPEHDGYWGYDCAGCDLGGHAESGAGWPCSTIELILEGLDAKD